MRLTSKMPVHEPSRRRDPRTISRGMLPSRVHLGRGFRLKGRITRPRRER
jgi:hypothetical protein